VASAGRIAHACRGGSRMSAWVELGEIDRIVHAALAEDLASGDVTGRLTVPAHAIARGRIVAKQSLVVCGGLLVERTFAAVDASLSVELRVPDGSRVEPGTELVSLAGNARALLAGERTALNLFGRACAVATLTRAYVDAAGPELRVID